MPIKLLIDSGSQSNIIDDQTWKRLKENNVAVHKQIKSPNKIFMAYASQRPLNVLGGFDAIITVGTSKQLATFYVVKNGL